jgi:hypothetical protein
VVFKGNARTIDHVRRARLGHAHPVRRRRDRLSLLAGEPELQVGTSFADAATYLAKQLQGIDVSAFVQKIDVSARSRAPSQQFVNGVTLFGNAGEELERLMAAAGYQLSIQDHELTALKLAQTSSVVVILSPRTGLVGSPEHGTPERSGLPSILKAKCLLQPRIRPGDRVRFETSPTTGSPATTGRSR